MYKLKLFYKHKIKLNNIFIFYFFNFIFKIVIYFTCPPVHFSIYYLFKIVKILNNKKISKLFILVKEKKLFIKI